MKLLIALLLTALVVTPTWARKNNFQSGEWPFPLSVNPMPTNEIAGCWQVRLKGDRYSLCLNPITETLISADLRGSQNETLGQGTLLLHRNAAAGQMHTNLGQELEVRLAKLHTNSSNGEQIWIQIFAPDDGALVESSPLARVKVRH